MICDLLDSPGSSVSSGCSTPNYSISTEADTATSYTSISSDIVLRSSPSKSAKLEYARSIIQREAEALQSLVQRLTEDDQTPASNYEQALDALIQLPEHAKVLVTGIGKSNLIGRKAAATFCSLGIPCTFLDATNALHGDLGLISSHRLDIIIFISYSGSTQELVNLLPLAKLRCSKVIAVTAFQNSPLARESDIWLDGSVPDGKEADVDIPAPTSSAMVALSLLHALALGASRSKIGWEAKSTERSMAFLQHHPAGSIGQYLSKLNLESSRN